MPPKKQIRRAEEDQAYFEHVLELTAKQQTLVQDLLGSERYKLSIEIIEEQASEALSCIEDFMDGELDS